MTHPTDDEIMELAGSWFHTGENQKRDDGYYYRSLGTPSNVRGSDLIEFARALLAEQARTEPKAFTDDELRAEVKLRIERSGQTQEGYAKAHGYSPQYLSDFLTGKRLPGDKILQGEGLQAQTLYLDSMAVRVGVTGHNRFATRGDAGNLACKKCGARGLFTQIHQRPDGSDCGYLAHIVFAAQPLKAEQAKDAAEDAELLEWLEEKHYALHPIKEDQGDDTYTLWWQVTDKDKSISGHPLGNIRAAIRAARAAERKA